MNSLHRDVTSLTIAIPTFQRNQLLRTNLAHLLRQAGHFGESGHLRVMIIDNASSEPVAASLGHLPPWVEIHRNPHNIGGNANIVRCFELCSTPWLWIMGDDDRPDENAVANALQHITTQSTAKAIVYAVRNQATRPRPFTAAGVDGLLRQLDSFANLLFVPSTLYHVATLRPCFDLSYHYAYSCAPHLVLLLTSLAKHGGETIFVTESNIDFERPEIENRGSIFPIAHGLPILLELPDLTTSARRQLARHLGRFPSLASLVHQTLLRQCFGSVGTWGGMRDYLSAVNRLPIWVAPLRRLAAYLALPALLVPRISFPIVAWTYQLLTGQTSGRLKLPLERL